MAMLQMMVLRTMAQARYAPEPLGHFGLALSHYAHFTSPIRRYPDLLLHRAIKHVLSRKKPASFAYSAEAMEQLGTHCSTTERRADDATRDVSSWLKCEFMSHRVGESFDGLVSAVTSFGVFVDLTGLYIDGLVHISTLGDDYYSFDPKLQKLIGRRSGHSYALGQAMRVTVARVNLEERKIDLVPAVEAGRGKQSVVEPKSSEPVHRLAQELRAKAGRGKVVAAAPSLSDKSYSDPSKATKRGPARSKSKPRSRR